MSDEGTFYCMKHRRSETEAEHIAAGGKPRLCFSCRSLSSRWLDSKPSEMIPAFGIVYGSGAPYDASAAGVHDRWTQRINDWAALVREHRRAIAQSCREGVHVAG